MKPAMTAKEYLLSEGEYCRWQAARCADPFIAGELRRLAECFEQTATARPAAKWSDVPRDDRPVELGNSR
jgi:hypothetical protein